MIAFALTQASDAPPRPPPLPFADGALLPLAVTAGALLLFVAGFSLYTLWLRRRNLMEERRWIEREARWGELVLQALSDEAAGGALRSRVGPRERLAFLDFLLRYARRIRGPERARLEELAAPFLPELGPQLEAGDPYRRARAVQILGALGLPAHEGSVVRGLDDEAPFVAMVAARALAARGSPEDRRRVVARLERFGHWSEEYLTSLLADIGPEAAPDLRGLLADRGRSRRVRRVAAGALHQLHDLEAAEAAAALLRRETDPEVLAPLLKLIAALGAPLHLAAARPFLGSEHDPVRGAAFRAVGALGADEDAACLRAGVDDPSPWVAREAARALRRSGRSQELRELARSPHARADLADQILREAP